MRHQIEKSKLFPYIAWGLILLFAGFTLKLTLTLIHVADSLTQVSLK